MPSSSTRAAEEPPSSAPSLLTDRFAARAGGAVGEASGDPQRLEELGARDEEGEETEGEEGQLLEWRAEEGDGGWGRSRRAKWADE
jgi:hypothetical protein